MFGRDWQEKEEYADIADYHPTRQAWEFLRRKPSYQIDCKVALEIRKWIASLPLNMFMRVNNAADEYNLPGETLANIMMKKLAGHKVKVTPDVENGIKSLTTTGVKTLSANAGEWLAPRHNLRDWARDLPAMPSQNEPDNLDRLFKRSMGGEVITSTAGDFCVDVPAQHAAIIVDLTQSTGKQLKNIAKKIKNLQAGIQAEDSFQQRGILPHKGKAKERDRSFLLLPTYIRLLDALVEKGPGLPRDQDLYSFFKPTTGNKTNPSQYITDLSKKAKRFRDRDYNVLAQRGQDTQLTVLLCKPGTFI